MSRTEERQTSGMLIMGMKSIKHGIGQLRTAMRSALNAPEEVGNEASENELQREDRAPEQVPVKENIPTYIQAIYKLQRHSKSKSPSPTEVQEQVEPSLRAESPVVIGPLPVSSESPVKPPDNLLGPVSGVPKAKSDENDRSPSEEGSQASETDAQIVCNLPAIYQRRGSDNPTEGVNYPPSAITEDNVEKFLEAGQDPNCLWQETGDSPLHLAVTSGNYDITGMLLRGGADTNLANKDGLTPLHVICSRDQDEDLAELFFKIGNEVNQPVKVDARDNLGRTPLQLAVAHFMPRVLDVVLDNGADVSSFVYPTESYLGDRWVMDNNRCDDFMVHLAYDALIILKRLKERGYELDRRAALTIMEFFAKHHLFKSPVDLDECWYDDEQFAMQAKKYEVSPSLSFYDLVRLRPEKANKLFTYDMFDDYYEETFWKLSEKCDEALNAHLGEIIMRGFCRQWALDCFLELTHYKLPILCCEIIFETLMNKDLCSIFMAVAGQSS
ncbi:unnamed protein product [Trichogramma brassicae]|uniref:Uncharacterized protein n=1 Tax=Trichogramma brassicae TaxID=86971 RepID=A0A6H5IXA4_9HYME|nr:unnamed protein product [Trichogramma brassicae]